MILTFSATCFFDGTIMTFTNILSRQFSDFRYSIMQNGNATVPTSAVELAVDFHVIRVIAATNFQRCVNALWRGYYSIQYYNDNRLIVGQYKYLTSQRFRQHFDTQRVKGIPPESVNKVPLYQNILNLFFTLLFVLLYTIAVNTPTEKGEFDIVEGFLFAFALGFFFDEVTKM
jgi:hypothetical protein